MRPEQDLLRRFAARAGNGRLFAKLQITAGGFMLGATVLAKMGRDAHGRRALADEARAAALLAAAFGRPPEPYVFEKMRRAAELWNAGEKALAHIHLAFARLPPLANEEQALLLFLAGECLDRGVPPAEVTKARGFAPALLALLKYDPDQPRVPAGSGPASGQWTSDEPGGGSEGQEAPAPASVAAAPVAPAAADASDAAGTLAGDLFSNASPRFLAGLGELAATIGGWGAVLGVLFVPSPNPGVTAEGEVPGDSGLHYRIDRPAGTLRLTNKDGEIVAAASLGPDGIFYDAASGEPVARYVGDSVAFDEDRLKSVAAPAPNSDAATQPASAVRAAADENAPKLCPDPGPDIPHGSKERADKYQEQISRLNNPLRPLSADLAVSLINPVTGRPVYYDDCRESDGTLIEAKGPGYADALQRPFMVGRLTEEWINQATKQVQASEGRPIEWYFAEKEAANKARDIFEENDFLSARIIIFTVPAEVP